MGQGTRAQKNGGRRTNTTQSFSLAFGRRAAGSTRGTITVLEIYAFFEEVYSIKNFLPNLC
jgi:hypothetical protein